MAFNPDPPASTLWMQALQVHVRHHAFGEGWTGSRSEIITMEGTELQPDFGQGEATLQRGRQADLVWGAG